MNKIKSIILDQTNWLEINIENEEGVILHCESFGDSDEYQDLLRQRLGELNVETTQELESILEEQISKRHIPTEEEIEAKRLAEEEQRVLLIKSRAEELITAKYSIIWQLNHPRSSNEYIKEYEWIDNIRKISNEAEANNLELDEIDWGL